MPSERTIGSCRTPLIFLPILVRICVRNFTETTKEEGDGRIWTKEIDVDNRSPLVNLIFAGKEEANMGTSFNDRECNMQLCISEVTLQGRTM